MIGLETILGLVSTERSFQQEIDLAEYMPRNFGTISAVSCSRQNLQPKLISFEVPKDQVLVGLRIEGNTLLYSHRSDSARLLTSGSVYLMTGGRYSALFAKRPSKTVFLVANRASIPGFDAMFRETSGSIPHTQIDLESDPKMRRVQAILEPTQRKSIFKFNAIISDVFDQITNPAQDGLLEYGVASDDPLTRQLCAHVVSHPEREWTTALGAQQCSYSVYHFSRTFKAKTGQGFPEFVNLVRAIQAVKMICEGSVPAQIAFDKVGIYGGFSANKSLQRELGFSVADIQRFNQARMMQHVNVMQDKASLVGF
jgi:AraC-like DNA-binding protein